MIPLRPLLAELDGGGIEGSRASARDMGVQQPKERFLKSSGLRLHYLVWGHDKNPPLLLLHGFLAHAHFWDDFARRFQPRYHVIALDQRGHGESQWSKEGAYTIYDHFRDLAGFIEALKLNHLILVGHSMGGRNALFYAACIPTYVERLILVDARAGKNPQAAQMLRHILLTFSKQARSIQEWVDAIQSIYPRLSPTQCRYIIRRGFQRNGGGKFIPGYDPSISQQLERFNYQTDDLGIFLKNIRCPTLIIRGSRSPFLSRVEAEKMTRAIPQAELREIPKSTHLPSHENPGFFYKVISDFLNQKVF
jgi:pimeloyl-ACP methyl ester carboxylesterase